VATGGPSGLTPRVPEPNLCPNCGASLPLRIAVCAQCGARAIVPAGYEWKSRLTWMGSPVVHVAFGCDATGRAHLARGVIAIGQRAVGGVAIGIVATGFVAIGLVGIGAFSLGVVAVGIVAACGVNALGFFAIGIVAAGWKVGGFAAIGEKVLFSRMR
jgi:hypothetical protein